MPFSLRILQSKELQPSSLVLLANVNERELTFARNFIRRPHAGGQINWQFVSLPWAAYLSTARSLISVLSQLASNPLIPLIRTVCFCVYGSAGESAEVNKARNHHCN
jgi:hypothetical protein